MFFWRSQIEKCLDSFVAQATCLWGERETCPFICETVSAVMWQGGARLPRRQGAVLTAAERFRCGLVLPLPMPIARLGVGDRPGEHIPIARSLRRSFDSW